jgi:hypothetical protein
MATPENSFGVSGSNSLMDVSSDDMNHKTRDPLLEYDPEKPIQSGPLMNLPPESQAMASPEIPAGANYKDEVTKTYQQNSPQVQAARNNALERYAGKGTLFSDVAARGGEAAAFDKAMELSAPDVQLRQDLVKSQDQFNKTSALTRQQGDIQKELGEQSYTHSLGLEEKRSELNEKTQTLLHEFDKENAQIANDFKIKLDEMNFSQDMEQFLLTSVNGMINSGSTFLTTLATSPDATEAEVNKVRQSIINGLTTMTNIWKGSSGSTDTFDFSGIG